jgi:hypothetical protein
VFDVAYESGKREVQIQNELFFFFLFGHLGAVQWRKVLGP